ncbi:putative Diguanylate cyclase [Planktothrix agardhii]|uniref:diguanylate cyclase domain-containing protein n=1 Tax=Planktothrix agardhii TaxID=1160 RepID=UPI001B9F0537|nr:diguanylate cyclase [Planktothrix agardhii]CAD0231144.1 putative Diguanylate cyclase [Planktothrix agardhii]
MLVEGITEVANQSSPETLRAIEILNHTTVMISLYTLDGVPLMQNPSALECYGDTLYPSLNSDNAFVRHFVDPQIGETAIVTAQSGAVFSIETQVYTLNGIRWHGLDVRCTRDPVTGNAILLVNEKDITEQQTALIEHLHTEQELRWKEALLRSMTDTSNLAFFVVDNRTDNIIYFNHRFCKIWGVEHLEIQMLAGVLKNNDIIPDCITLIADVPAFAESCKPLQSEENRAVIEDKIAFSDGRTIRRFSSQIRDQSDTVRKQVEETLKQQAEGERMIYTITQRIRQSLDLDEILQTTVAEVRQFLQTDRVMIYRFNSDWSGLVVKESVSPGTKAILKMEITDSYFVENQGQYYQQNTIKATPNIYTAGLTPCHLELLEKLQVQAKLVVPIILQTQGLWGLLVAHHCTKPREWQNLEIELMQQLAIQLAIAIHQSELHQQLQLANQQLQNLAMVDKLTQIANRRCFDEILNQEWHRLVREKRLLSLLLCDIDYFKQYNDTYGHSQGDICLQQVAQALQQGVQRSIDLVARYGGEEFVVILPHTDQEGALEVAKKIQDVLEQFNLPHRSSNVADRVTMSIGICTLIPTVERFPLDLINEADHSLYQAKTQGRNRAVGSIL